MLRVAEERNFVVEKGFNYVYSAKSLPRESGIYDLIVWYCGIDTYEEVSGVYDVETQTFKVGETNMSFSVVGWK